MITVIIAGGSGTRLWPLSTPTNPKQLLALTSERTMVQQSYDRASQLGEKVYVVTEASHASALREQLPELPDEAFLIEPGRRGTAHCILFALDYIARTGNVDEPIAFLSSDHNIRDIRGFKASFETAGQISERQRTITLVGIEPTFPATGFGYIERDGAIDESRGVYKVESFKEKPDYDTAQQYVQSGNYLWNCGYFVGSVNTFIETMELDAPELLASYKTLTEVSEHAGSEYNQTYLDLDNQVIDIALIEKANKLAVVSASFDWADIGNFRDLHDAVEKDQAGNYQHGENIHTLEAENSYIRNEEADKPIAIIGLDNVVVVNTPDGILVARKDVAAKCGDIAKKLQSR